MRRLSILASVAALLGLVTTPSPSIAQGDFPVATGGDEFRSGYVKGEPPPYFADRPVTQPKPEWITKISDLPSAVYPIGGIVVAEGLVILGGAATNTIIALDQDTGLPVWRFSPDPRGSRYFPGDGYSGAYPATNAPWYSDGVVYGTFSNGTLFALDASSGEKIWRWEVPRAGAPGEAKDHVLNPKIEWDFFNPEHREFPLRSEVKPYTGDYPKLHSAVAFCDGVVYVETLDARLFAVRASTGQTIWHRYVGAPDWPGEFAWLEFAVGGIVARSGRSTRRFEAQGGPGCVQEYVFVPTEDGYLKMFDKDTGLFAGAYDSFHEGDLGYANDGGAGIVDPESKDLIVNFLNDRMIRLSVPQLKPRWRHVESGGQLSLCTNNLDRSTCTVLLTSQEHHQDGPIGSAVFAGLPAIDPNRRIIFNPNQDGHLYMWTEIDALGTDPTLHAMIPNRRNPLSKPDPAPDSIGYYIPRDDRNGAWERSSTLLSAPLIAGGVVYYYASFEHAVYGVKYLDGGKLLAEPEKVFRYEVKWDDTFQYPPFGDTYPKPVVDIDLLTVGAPAIADGHMYFAANDGQVYSFNLRQPSSRTVRNLAVLGSGLVPFIPEWRDALGAFDRVWTPAEWYKNQVPPEGFRLPTPGQLVPFGLPAAALAVWARTRRSRRRSARGGPAGGPHHQAEASTPPRKGRWEGFQWR